MKKIFLLFLTLLSLKLSAQSISVKSFQMLVGDMTTTSLEGKRIDQNNEVCALIKIVTSQKGFTFEAGALGVVDSQQRNGEIWVWVPRGSRKITILHQQLGVLRDYRYPVEIQADRTYEMILVTGTIETIVKEEVREQYLIFQITPPDAVLEVNDQVWPVSAEGVSSRLMSFGTYNYRVQASNYHPEAGVVTLNDPDNTKKIEIRLNPNFGWIEVTGAGNLQGANVYVDNALIGKAPCKSGPLKSGKYNVKIVKELYESYNTSVDVSDNKTSTIAPTLTANFARVTLKVDADAEIWVNNEKKGVRSWTGDLVSGVYRIETKQEGHEPAIMTKEIENHMNGEVIQLDAPRPIYGSLVVESTPEMATFTIDGKPVGETPKLIKEILVGRHTVVFTRDGYDQQTETITIAKGERTQLKTTLNKTPERPAPQANKPTNNSNGQKTSTNSQTDLNALYQRINAALEAGKGMSVLNDLLELDSHEHNNPNIPFVLGTLYGDPINRIYDPDKAIASYQKALRINPNHYDANYNLGALYITLANELIVQANEITGVSKSELEQYDILMIQSEEKFRTGLPYLEKAYQLQPSEDVKTALLAIYKRLKMDSKLKGLK